MPLNKPYGILRFSIGFLQHLLVAKGADGLHSPFIFDLYTRIIKGKEVPSNQNEIEQYRRELKKNHSSFSYKDFKTGQLENSSISKHAKHSPKSKKLASILYRLVKSYQPKMAIELGTNLGIGLAYMQSATDYPIKSIEGIPELHEQSEKLLKGLGLKAQTHLGAFAEMLPQILDSIEKLDVAFIDGDHTYEGTLSYFNVFLPLCHEKSILIFDDIHWSPGMEKAWREIQNHPRITRTLDGYFFGIAFFNQGAVKQHFKVRL